MKFFSRLRFRELLPALAFPFLLALAAVAQTAPRAAQVSPGTNATISPAKGVAPTPAQSPQNPILKAALSPQTRHTLQQAMDSAPTPDTSHSTPPAK